MATFSPDALAAKATDIATAGAEPISRKTACRLLRASDDALPFDAIPGSPVRTP
jgi:hypothetical protein